MAEKFKSEVEIGVTDTGQVMLTFGPLRSGDVVDLLEFIGASEEFRDNILEHVSSMLAQHLMGELDDV